MASFLISENQHSATIGGYTPPGLCQTDADIFNLAGTCLTPELKDDLKGARQTIGIQQVAHPEATTGNVDRQATTWSSEALDGEAACLTFTTEAECFKSLQFLIGIGIIDLSDINGF
jgi:hypothetical protein